MAQLGRALPLRPSTGGMVERLAKVAPVPARPRGRSSVLRAPVFRAMRVPMRRPSAFWGPIRWAPVLRIRPQGAATVLPRGPQVATTQARRLVAEQGPSGRRPSRFQTQRVGEGPSPALEAGRVSAPPPAPARASIAPPSTEKGPPTASIAPEATTAATHDTAAPPTPPALRKVAVVATLPVAAQVTATRAQDAQVQRHPEERVWRVAVAASGPPLPPLATPARERVLPVPVRLVAKPVPLPEPRVQAGPQLMPGYCY